MAHPDRLRHVFSTFLGIPPDSGTPPVCGATLMSAYDGRNQPDCPTCTAALQRWQANTCPYCGGPYTVHRRCTAAGYCQAMAAHVALVTAAAEDDLRRTDRG